MKYEKSRQEFYEEELRQMARQISEILDSGYSVEICRSRSGLKMYSCRKRHEVIRKGGTVND